MTPPHGVGIKDIEVVRWYNLFERAAPSIVSAEQINFISDESRDSMIVALVNSLLLLLTSGTRNRISNSGLLSSTLKSGVEDNVSS